MKKLFTFLMALAICVGANAQSADRAPNSNMTQSKLQKEQASLITSGISQTNVPQSFYQTPPKGLVEIGTETLTERYPVYSFYNYSYTQSIYLQSELGAADNITQIWYYFAGTTLTNSNDWTIYMGHTSKTQFSSISDWVPLASMTQVYSSTFTDPGAPGWILFDITDFAYNGTDNLVIAVDENKADYDAATNKFYSSAVTNTRSLNWYSDATNFDPATPGDASYCQAFLPNTRLLIGTTPSHDLAVNDILPITALVGVPVTPQVKVRNLGANNEAVWSINLKDGAGYNQTVTNSVTINSTQSIVVDFPTWTPTVAGPSQMTAIVTLASDVNHLNDTMHSVCQVVPVSYDNGYSYGYDAYSAGTANARVVRNPLATGVLEDLAAGTSADFLACAEYIDGVVYGIEYGTNNVYIVNGDGTMLLMGTLSGVTVVSGIAYDQLDNVIYVADYNGSESILYSVNPDYSTNLIGTIGSYIVIGIATDADGDLFGIEIDTDNFMSIDKATGAGAVIGALGIDINYAQDIGGDKVNDVIYGALYTSTGGWYTIDKTTGVATLISAYDDEITACAIVPVLETYSVTVTVTDGTDPIQGANIVVATLSVNGNTDASGQLVIADVAPETYSYSVSATGYVPYDGTFVVVDQDITIPVVLVSTDIAEFNTHVSVIPNPSSGIFTVSADQNYLVEVLDLTGRVIQSVNMTNNNASIDITSESNGMYIIRFTNENGTGIAKVIKK